MTTDKHPLKSSRRRKPLKSERLYLQCSFLIRPEGKQFSSWCPELDVASSGDTVEEARTNLDEAIKAFLDTYSELGELGRLINERGIKLIKAEDVAAPVYLSQNRIDVPNILTGDDAILVST